MSSTFVKDPQAVLDYAFDWSLWLAASETISAATVTVPTGITKDSQNIAAGVVTAWLSSGTAGEDYPVVCHITTNQGRTDDRTLKILCRDR